MLNRNGVSLLEVLISVFVLLVGLLGVAALIPVGGVRISQATIADRSGMCGRAGLHEIKIRGWLEPEEWLRVLPNPTPPPLILASRVAVSDGAGKWGIPYRDSFAIDPLFLAANGTNNLARNFPLHTLNYLAMRRVTLDVDPSAGVLRMSGILADRIFTWHDDMSFPMPSEPEDRPRQMMLWDNGEGAVFPFRPADGANVNNTNVPLAAHVEGNYSWMVTVTPMPDGLDFVPSGSGPGAPEYSFVDRISNYEVSIVVFHKRDHDWPSDPDLPIPEERSVFAVLEGGGWGGGDAVLVVTDAAAVAQAGDWLHVREGDWLMLRGVELPGTRFQKVICKWYRVIAVDDQLIDGDANPNDNIPGGAVGCYVTLAGPNWQIDTSGNWMFNPAADVAIASLIDNVVGVYTTTIEAGSN